LGEGEKAKQGREDVTTIERLQSSIEKCIADVAATNAVREEKEATREVKFDAWWATMFKKQEVKIGLLKTNVAAIKRKEDLDRRYVVHVRRGEGVAQGIVRHHLG
jgi:uncharacterized protein YcaQ